MKKGTLAVVLSLLALWMVGCVRSDFSEAADVAKMEKALTAQGLQICAQEALAWNTLPGFAEGKYYELGTNCAAHDPTSPGARVWIAAYADGAARDAALRNFESGRRLKSPATTWTKGPVVVVLDGAQNPEVMALVRQAMAAAGAK